MKANPGKTILIPLPSYGFDPTETGVPWKKLSQAEHRIIFATPDGKPAAADIRMLNGRDLPFFLRASLVAQSGAVRIYEEMSVSTEFRNPISYEEIDPSEFDALLLPGGHDKGMRDYLESKTLQNKVATFFDRAKPVGAICHGTLLAARTQSIDDQERRGKSVLWGRKTTGLTRNQELVAFYLTRFWLGDYYRTYDVPMAEELVSNLRSPDDFFRGPGFPIPLNRDSDRNLIPGFTVRDGSYLSARWPGDAHRFAVDFLKMIEETSSKKKA